LLASFVPRVVCASERRQEGENLDLHSAYRHARAHFGGCGADCRLYRLAQSVVEPTSSVNTATDEELIYKEEPFSLTDECVTIVNPDAADLRGDTAFEDVGE
jgi:hypothetical protein